MPLLSPAVCSWGSFTSSAKNLIGHNEKIGVLIIFFWHTKRPPSQTYPTCEFCVGGPVILGYSSGRVITDFLVKKLDFYEFFEFSNIKTDTIFEFLVKNWLRRYFHRFQNIHKKYLYFSLQKWPSVLTFYPYGSRLSPSGIIR